MGQYAQLLSTQVRLVTGANETRIDGLYGRGQRPNHIDFRLRHRTTVPLSPDPHSAPLPDRRSLEVFLLTISTPFSFLTTPPTMPPRRNLPEVAKAAPLVAVLGYRLTESAIQLPFTARILKYWQT